MQVITNDDLWKHKRFVRYKDGCQLYSMSLEQFKKIAHEAGAVYKRDKMVLVNVELVDEYLELFHLRNN